MYGRRVVGVGYPRVIGYAPGTGIYGEYVAGAEAGVPMLAHAALPVHPPAAPAIHSPPWRPMLAPGSPPLGEGHVPIPLNPETFGGVFGNTAGGGAPAGTRITFSARPQKPFKTARILINKTPVGTSSVGRLVGQIFVGTDLQQGELGDLDLESLGAATAFDTWVSMKQAEPGVWIRINAGVTAQPTGTDFIQYNVQALGHYLH